MESHPVFHVSLLKRSGAEQANLELPLLLEEKDEQKESEAIVDRRVVYNQGVPLIRVLVKWGLEGTNGDTWEYLPSLLQRFPRVASLLSIS